MWQRMFFSTICFVIIFLDMYAIFIRTTMAALAINVGLLKLSKLVESAAISQIWCAR